MGHRVDDGEQALTPGHGENVHDAVERRAARAGVPEDLRSTTDVPAAGEGIDVDGVTVDRGADGVATVIVIAAGDPDEPQGQEEDGEQSFH